MEKTALLRALESQVSATLRTLRTAAEAAREAATHEESKPENEYDTRGLEASYLAAAQSNRILDLEEMLALFHILASEPLPSFGPDDAIASTALVTVNCEGTASRYFVLPKGGGLSTTENGVTTQVVTPASPLGEALLGRRVGDEFELSIQRRRRDYEIIAVE